MVSIKRGRAEDASEGEMGVYRMWDLAAYSCGYEKHLIFSQGLLITFGLQ